MDVQDVIPLPNSKKLFRSIELKNGLSALLVSDPELEWKGLPAGVSLAVRAGSFLDPAEAQGLAHFLEHMLFLGSDKFPMENALDQYLNMHGGDSSAATDDDHTLFFLFAKSKLLENALDMFSRTFIAPLMQPDSMNREIESIDSEFEILKQSDTSRLYQLRRHTSKNDYSFNRFTAGNKRSLRSKNMEALLTRTKLFFDDHYHGGSMKLCVIGRDSLSDLESWVRKYFGGVKNSPKRMPAINPPPKPIWDAKKLHVIKSVEGMTSLVLVWMFPPYPEKSHLEMPEVYLIELLSNKSKASLYGFFKEKDWVTDIEVSLEGHLGHYRSGGRLFSFSLYLTQLGLKKKYEMINYVYQYIKLLRDMTPREWVWNQYWKMKEIEFDCLDVSGMAANSPLHFAQYLSVNMLKYPVAHVVSADYVPKSWNPKAIVDLLEEFTPQNMRIDLLVNSLDAADPRTEPWFGTHFLEEQIPLEMIKKWSNISEVDGSLRFPEKNPFIATAINVRRDIAMPTNAPICIVNKPIIKMWHQSLQDGPAYAYFCIDFSDGDIKKQVMKYLFTELVMEQLTYILFEGKQASISNSFSVCEDKLVLKFEGYREHFTLFISKFWLSFKSFSPTLKHFESIKEQMLIDLSSTDIKEQSQDMMSTMLYEGSYDVKEKLQNLKEISFSDLQNFVRVLYSQIFIEALCYGDMLETEAYEISKVLESTFEELRTPQLRNRSASDRVKKNPPPGRKDSSVVKKSETNSMAKVYYQTSNPEYKLNEEEDGAKLSLFSAIIKEELYDQLRTKKQLGYDVSCYKDVTSGVYGLYIDIVSSKYDPNRLLDEIDGFVNGIELLLANMQKDSFNNYKESVRSELFDDRNSKWKEIVCKRYKFDCHKKEAEEIEFIEDYELKFWYNKYFKASSPSCRKFSVGIWGGQHQKEEEESSEAPEKKKSKHKAF